LKLSRLSAQRTDCGKLFHVVINIVCLTQIRQYRSTFPYEFYSFAGVTDKQLHTAVHTEHDSSHLR